MNDRKNELHIWQDPRIRILLSYEIAPSEKTGTPKSAIVMTKGWPEILNPTFCNNKSSIS
jgi:hypothetical protein